MSWGIGRRRGSDPELLWLWRRPVAIAPIGPLAWEPPYAAGAAQEITKKKRQKKKRSGSNLVLLWLWRKPAITVPIGPLAWEPPYATGAAQEMVKRQKKKKERKKAMQSFQALSSS